ncbi:hypothetical protein S58_42900 [Bradyrhizobium oligotrophicum S58]|uniref:Uncharacterized protein n=1 Tax=Bradyrhizobium oligotrophicum S58 TaxID=1245469 RepID=M4ZVB1_9BRAD|nr:contractile injection system tape measure protein [Bradyrhizobium oligotrophicum]BAM90275.1 hypothetical protein S58_42900 [Bradyrhizobium oligotrophicum S58]
MAQRHAIHRQIVEVTVANAAMAERIGNVVSDVIRDAVTPLLERMFDALTPHAEILRLDRLELDLGRLDLASLQRELPARISAKLPDALRQSAARDQRSGGSSASAQGGRTKPDADAAAMLVITHFVATGTLPWWCDGRGRDLVDRAASEALQRSPASLAHALRGFVTDPSAMNRLVGHISDATLERIVVALTPDGADDLRELALLLENISIGDLTPNQTRRARWQGILQAACAGSQPDIVEAALTAMAVAADVPLTSVLAARKDMTATPSSPTAIAARVDELQRLHSAPSRAARSWSQNPVLTALHAELLPLAARLPEQDQQAWTDAFARLAQTPAGSSYESALSALLQPLRQAGLITSVAAERLQARLSRRAAPAAARRDPRERGELDESHVAMTAGICLLWPFLARFFARLHLLDGNETGFASLVAQQRAVLLLHHLATGERDAPEFALLLPKVLCGLPPFDPCEITEPVTDTEATEAAQLLDAAIAHASCLGTISHAGLRETFLLRQGMLGTRDGAWLLRLERRSADVLLERIPWTLQWLRLPWMQAAMRVEW